MGHKERKARKRIREPYVAPEAKVGTPPLERKVSSKQYGKNLQQAVDRLGSRITEIVEDE